MDVGSIAGAFVAAQAGQFQSSVAIAMLKMNAKASNEVVQMLQASQQNLSQLANAAAGLGQNVNITV